MSDTKAAAPTIAEALEALFVLSDANSAIEKRAAYKTIRAALTAAADLTAEVERLRGEADAWTKHQEICSGNDDNDTPTELDHLNPYKRGWKANPAPTEQPANFIHGVRYYLGMLEDGGNWSHELGHIEELCAAFQKAIDERAGKAPPASP